jgi:nitrous oxide reductase accessory protein NosL
MRRTLVALAGISLLLAACSNSNSNDSASPTDDRNASIQARRYEARPPWSPE